MDYKKLVKDLLVGCSGDCANCEHSEHVEFNCTIDKTAADVILELFIENKILNKKNSDLQARAKNAEVRAEQVERELEAAVKELDGVSEAVDSLSEFIDREVFHIVNYNIYAALRNKSDYIATWKYESKWRGQKGE